MMEFQNALLWEVSPFEFLLVTVVLGGGAAWMTGRAVALGWGSNRILGFYTVLLAAAVRFIHFALFQGTLISPYYYIVDIIVLLGIAYVAKRHTRAGQMALQYSFKYTRSGPLSWKAR